MFATKTSCNQVFNRTITVIAENRAQARKQLILPLIRRCFLTGMRKFDSFDKKINGRKQASHIFQVQGVLAYPFLGGGLHYLCGYFWWILG